MSISGVVSGIDWDSMIDSIIESASQPAMVQVNKRTNLTNKKSLLEEMKVSMQALQSSISPLKLPSTYKAKELEIERLDSNSSYKSVLTATVNADAEVNVYNLEVKQLATAQTLRSNQITGTFSAINSTMNSLSNGKIYINAGGQRVGVDVTSTDTLTSLKSKLNTAMKTQSTPMAVTASVVDNKLILKSDNTGIGSDTVTETFNYSTDGITTLNDITIDSKAVEDGTASFEVKKGSKTWTQANGDFQIINGNTLRWHEYDLGSDTIDIGDDFTAKYKSYAGDTFSISATRGSGTTDSSVLNFTATINDESRFTITATETDDDGNSVTTTYNYGDDFTISGNSIVWKTEATVDSDGNTTTTTKGPSRGTEYTLNYKNASTTSVSANSITVDANGYNGLYFSNEEGTYSGSYLSYSQIPSSEKITNGDGIEIIDGSYLEFEFTDSSGNAITYDGVYGTDFYVNAGMQDSSGNYLPVIRWASNPPDEGVKVTVKYTGSAISGTDDGNGDIFNFSMNRSTQDTTIYSTDSDDQPLYSKFSGGTVTITQGSKTFYEGIDFSVVQNGTGSSATAAIEWNEDSSWFIPDVDSSSYTINLTQADGTTNTYYGIRNKSEELDLSDYGFTSVNGSMYGINRTVDSSIKAYVLSEDGVTDALGMTTSKSGTVFNFNWQTPEKTLRSNMPERATDGEINEYTATYTYGVNTFTIEDNMDGEILSALGLDYPKDIDETDEEAVAEQAEHYTAAQDAILVLDGEEVTRSSNYIGEAYNNELIKGMTIQLKGTGTVSLDISQDAQKAVESIQTLVDNYNAVMSWMNTRMTESQLDEATAATVDSDDFRMRWGLLHGSSLLRQTKSQMRTLVSQNFTFTFETRTSSEPVYGTMAFNGLRSNTTLRITAGDKFADLTVTPEDTLETLLEKLNDNSESSELYDLYYDDDGNLLEQPLFKASVEDDMLKISAGTSEKLKLSGVSAMNVLKMNYTYKGLYQIGIATTSDDYGKSGELEFDTAEFMEALEDNPDEVQDLMLNFASQIDTWAKSMLTSSGDTSGVLTREIENIDSQISSIDEYLEDFQERLDRQEEMLKSKYAAAEQQIAKLTQQASSIAGILNQLNGYNNNSSSS